MPDLLRLNDPAAPSAVAVVVHEAP